jgi:hypothetical protein
VIAQASIFLDGTCGEREFSCAQVVVRGNCSSLGNCGSGVNFCAQGS